MLKPLTMMVKMIFPILDRNKLSINNDEITEVPYFLNKPCLLSPFGLWRPRIRLRSREEKLLGRKKILIALRLLRIYGNRYCLMRILIIQNLTKLLLSSLYVQNSWILILVASCTVTNFFTFRFNRF